MRVRRILAGLFVAAALVTASELPADVRRLAGLAASLPAEFQADSLLQIVESRGGKLDASQKKEFLEQASAAARQAKYPYPKTIATGINADSRQAFEAGALSLKLDRLSLELRAIRDLFAIDPITAREWFQQVQKPVPPAGTCNESLVPRLDEYFELATQAISNGFTPKEIEREDHVALTLQILTAVRAPYEIGPAARMIVAARLTPPQFQATLNAFTARLEAIAPDDRAFSETGLAMQEDIAALSSHTASLGLARGTLARAYRKYLTTSYSGPRCADSAGARIGGAAVSSPVEWFNQSDLRGDLAALEMKDLRGKEADGKLRLDLFWSTPDSEKILAAARGLRLTPGGVAYSGEERSSSEWSRKLQEFLEQLNDWKQSGEESELDFFNQRATVYESLIDVCPAGDTRQRLVAAFVDFLKRTNVYDNNPVDWFWHAQNMYRRLRQAGDTDSQKLLAAYRSSGNLMLEVYAQFNGQ